MRQLSVPQGNYFEDFHLDQQFEHGVPRTITESDATLYTALTGSRFALHCAAPLAQSCGFPAPPLDNWLLFHIAFGKTVNDISLNAVANLGYAEVEFHRPAFAGDTVSVSSRVIGLKENSSGQSGVVYVRSTAVDQQQRLLLSWIRWVMVEKREQHPSEFAPVIPQFSRALSADHFQLESSLTFRDWPDNVSDGQRQFDDFTIGDSLFHRDGITINDSDHSLATRLYQNNARVHFDQHSMQQSRHSKRLVYGGHIISLCRAISYNGLGNALWVAGINSGTHANPSFAGDTIYCQSEVIDKAAMPGREDLGLLRLRMLGIKNDSPQSMDFLYRDEKGKRHYHSNLVLDLDYWVMVRR